MNGTLRNYYNKRYLKRIKKKNPNIKYCLLLFDKSIYYGAKRSIYMKDCFDYIFSFDPEDCKEYGFIRFYNCFSKPKDMIVNKELSSDAFFIGNATGRLETLHNTFEYLSDKSLNGIFIMTGVKDDEKKNISNVYYNRTITFNEEMCYSYNSNCLIEVLRKGQTGISLRVCEAIAFNKKLVTNNINLKNETFYDERYMKIFENIHDIDIGFIISKEDVKYAENDAFSPIRILERIYESEMSNYIQSNI